MKRSKPVLMAARAATCLRRQAPDQTKTAACAPSRTFSHPSQVTCRAGRMMDYGQLSQVAQVDVRVVVIGVASPIERDGRGLFATPSHLVQHLLELVVRHWWSQPALPSHLDDHVL